MIVATYSIVACDVDAGQWGVATQSLGHTASGDRFYIYASAVTKRHSDWGPKGIDGLYRLDVTVGPGGTLIIEVVV